MYHVGNGTDDLQHHHELSESTRGKASFASRSADSPDNYSFACVKLPQQMLLYHTMMYVAVNDLRCDRQIPLIGLKKGIRDM